MPFEAQAIESYESRRIFATWYRLLTENLVPAASVERYSLPGAP